MPERIVDRKLSPEQTAGRESFLARLEPVDIASVDGIIRGVDIVADQYFKLFPDGWDPDMHVRGEPDFNASRFVDRRTGESGYPFVAVFGIGGSGTSGKIPDVDLLIVSNMYWTGGYDVQDGEPEELGDWEGLDEAGVNEWLEKNGRLEMIAEDAIVAQLDASLGADYNIELEGKLPDRYNLGVTQGKALLTLTRKDGLGKQIHVTYIKSIDEDPDKPQFAFKSLEQFEARDVDHDGAQLGRALLYKALSHDFVESGIDF